MMRHTAFIVLCFWILMTSAWWTLAFWPLSADSPGWISAAKIACFGSAPGSGLPDAGGWLMLTGAPLSMLLALIIAWGDDIRNSFRSIFEPNSRKALLAVVAFLLIAQSIWLTTKVQAGMRMASLDYNSDFTGPLPEHYPVINKAAPDIELTNQHNERIKLSEIKSKVTIVGFAFANCKTICPAITGNLTKAIDHFDSEEVSLLLITLDPYRDTVAALKSWSDRLNLPRNAHLLTGSVQEVERVLNAYQIPFKRDEKTGDVDHPAMTNIVDSKGQIIYALGNVPSQWITDAIVRILERKT